jgi:hypothetical protein
VFAKNINERDFVEEVTADERDFLAKVVDTLKVLCRATANQTEHLVALLK